MKSIQLALFAALTAAVAMSAPKQFRPGFNLFSKEQDIQLGKEAAAQVEAQQQVVKDAQMQAFVERIGRKLAASKLAGDYPYTFKVVNDPSINAFALPGGPTFLHTGLLKAAENEAQVAGVMAHELSHVALRHGTNQASKANLLQLPAMLAGAMAGGKGGLLGQLAQVGVGLGANSLLLKYSRDAERQADLLGAQMMAEAGYNPIEMARFFEKLNAAGGSNGGKMAAFFSDHPDPGDRTKYVEAEVRELPRREYTTDGSGELPRIQAKVNALPAPVKPAAAQVQQGGGAATTGETRPAGDFREFRNNVFAMQYPTNWEAFGDQGGGAVTIAPRAGLVQDRSGGVAVAYGAMVSMVPAQQGARADLRRDTSTLINQLRQSNPSLQVSGSQKSTRVGNAQALVTTMSNQSPVGGNEVDMLVTIARPEGLMYMIFIGPEKDFRNLQPTYERMLGSVRF